MNCLNQFGRVALVLGMTVGAFAQDVPADRAKDRRDIRHDQRDINRDKRDIRNDVEKLGEAGATRRTEERKAKRTALKQLIRDSETIHNDFANSSA